MQIIDKLAWIEIQDKQILSTRSRGKDTFYIPGGKREPGETDAQTLIREIKEELSIDLVASTINYLGTFEAQAHGHAVGVLVKMQCYTSAYTGTIQAASEIEEVAWLTSADKPKVSPVDKIIFDWLKSHGQLL
ncbi:NUDIX domain-containing protein [Pontibacter sp. KCTC 32443]|uniref:NUDIX hydrolase n=1 Tax=Pontibacter TaxID=323449 RepID=UPI00164E6F0C|nr:MULTISPECIES: NUDIX domain-containing protein [Pontibacter]MBC5775309.1 NUDIX domain-containing protein [Pontibacter sp. KCTC 32443]